MGNHMGILCLILVVPSTRSATMLAGVIRSMAIPSLQVSLSSGISLRVHFLCYCSLKCYVLNDKEL